MNELIRHTVKKTSKLRITSPLCGEAACKAGFTTQGAVIHEIQSLDLIIMMAQWGPVMRKRISWGLIIMRAWLLPEMVPWDMHRTDTLDENSMKIRTLFNIKTWGQFHDKEHFYRYSDYHYKGRMVVRLSYLYNRNSYNGTTTFLYWDSPLLLKYKDFCCKDKMVSQLSYIHNENSYTSKKAVYIKKTIRCLKPSCG